MSEENRDLLMGVFCTTADSAPALDALTTAVVRDLSERDGLLTAQIMRASIASKSRTLGVEDRKSEGNLRRDRGRLGRVKRRPGAARACSPY